MPPLEKTLGHGQDMRMKANNGASPPSSPAPPPLVADSVTGPPTYDKTVPKEQHIPEELRAPRLAGWARVKLILTVTSLTASVFTLLLTGMLDGQDGHRGLASVLIGSAAVAAALWNVAELARRVDVGEGIVPGAHVGVRLVLCGSWVTMACMSMAMGLVYEERPAHVPAGDGETATQVVMNGGETGPLGYTVIAMCGVAG